MQLQIGTINPNSARTA